MPWPPWSHAELEALRDHLRRGLSLVDTARSLQRDRADVERKISELYPSLGRTG
jgi:hypothetical protein